MKSRFSFLLLVLLALLGVYFLSYYIFVAAIPMRSMVGQPQWHRVAYYRLGDWSEQLYGPMVRLDHRLFPGRWLFTENDLKKEAAHMQSYAPES